MPDESGKKDVRHCVAMTWSDGYRPCKNMTRRRHPMDPSIAICYVHGGVE